MAKKWLSYQEQVSRLQERGLVVSDTYACESFLSEVSYYRFSGYFRYWQKNPKYGDDQFLDGINLETIENIYRKECEVADVIFAAIRRVEILIRTRFSHSYGKCVGSGWNLVQGEGLASPGSSSGPDVSDHVLRDLNRSKEAFVGRYRDNGEVDNGVFTIAAYHDLPVWVAVEVLSFGTLSRCVEASAGSGVLDDIAGSLNISKAILPGQIRSFVYLRNRIAHNARIWNHSVLDAPALPGGNRARKRIERNYGKFDSRSVYCVLVALDWLFKRASIDDDWLRTEIIPRLESDRFLKRGICSPRKYGNMDLS
jgi:putative uncharacterized protein (fragment)